MYIDRKYISLLSIRLEKFKKKNDDVYNFRCPFCGDSQVNQNKARGYIFFNEGHYIFKCHNCARVEELGNFIKFLDVSLYNQYRLEKFIKPEKKTYKKSQAEEAMFKNIFKSSFLDKHFSRVANLHIGHEVNKYLENRLIPHEKLSTLYFTDDLNCVKEDLPNYKNSEFGHDSRIIIPIFNRQKDLVGISCRSIEKNTKLRYINIKLKDDPLIYNLDSVNLSERIYAFEGAFDSMFVENSVAVAGTDFDKMSKFFSKDTTIVVLDNQPRNKEVVKQVYKIANKGWKVVIWPKTLKEKDVNEMIIEGMTKNSLMYILENNIYEGLQLKLKIADWSKCQT